MQLRFNSARQRRAVKKNARPWVLASILLFSLFLGLVTQASANELTVGTGQYTTIQAAVNAAQPGDTVLIPPGTYSENVLVNKSLTIKSSAGAATTIVKAAVPSNDVFLLSGSGIRVEGLTLTNGRAGVEFSGASQSSVTDIIAHDNVYAVLIEHAANNKVSASNLSNNGYGIYLDGSSGNTFSGNVATHESGNGNALGDGIYMRESNSNAIVQNVLSNNHVYGISLLSSSNNVLSNNSINANEEFAVRLRDNSNNNTFTFNTFSGNAKLAVYSGYSSGSRFYLNDFINNPVTIASPEGNLVNSTEKYTYTYSGGTYSSYVGNYYSDYKGVDSDGNGIGDTPSAIGDAYPLVHPIGQYGSIQLTSVVGLKNNHNTSNESTSSAEQSVSAFAGALIIVVGIVAAIIVVLKWAPRRDE
ncbi:MAG: right-handed parallel beta-helix repeat-containing protein [Halobacteriota archaeon]